jgi:hypothetical protein
MPMYVRALRLRHLSLTGTQCFLLFEGMIVVGTLLALAELVPWWGVFALPAAVAAMVKINDLIAGTTAWGTRRAASVVAPRSAAVAVRTAAGMNGYAARPGGMARHDRQVGGMATGRVTGRVIGRASVPAALRAVPPDENTTLGLAHATNVAPVAEPADSPRQRARQSAARRYE